MQISPVILKTVTKWHIFTKSRQLLGPSPQIPFRAVPLDSTGGKFPKALKMLKSVYATALGPHQNTPLTTAKIARRR